MKKIASIIICFISVNVFSQITFIGFSQPICTQPTTSVYTYSNYVTGGGSGAYAWFEVYRNGTIIYTAGGQTSQGHSCPVISFINDSTGFIVDRPAMGGNKVLKTTNYGMTWNLIGTGGPVFMALYPVNAHYVYLLTKAGNPFVELSRCSDLEPPQNQFILDQQINADIYVTDTAFHNSLCNIDTLDIVIKNNTDTIIYHINCSAPLVTGGIIKKDNVFISLSPNPTNGLLTISSSDAIQTIEVSTITGQILLTQPCSSKIEELQLEQFSNGVYFIKITLLGGRNTTKKVVVNH